MGKLINYRIIAITMDEGGTDNYIKMKMHGTNGESAYFDLEGEHDDNDTDALNKDHEDIGVITGITIDVDGTLIDKWTPYAIKILRDTQSDDESTADGYSVFYIEKELDYEPIYFSADIEEKPRVTLSPEGNPVINKERLTMVQFDHNPGQVSQTVMKYKETWGSMERVQISKEDRKTVGVNIKVEYESPETVAGKFKNEVGASWEREVANIRENETQDISQREFDWSFEADPRSYVFRLQVFEIPYIDQVYKDGDGNSRIIRKLHAEIIPLHLGDFLFIPRMDEGKVDPIPMSELRKDWMNPEYMSIENIEWIENRHLDKWLTKGWVFYDNQVPVSPIEMKALVITDALNIREDHDPKARILGHLMEGDEVTVVDTWTEGNNIWVKLKPDSHLPNPAVQWSAMLIGKNRYIKLIDDFANFPE